MKYDIIFLYVEDLYLILKDIYSIDKDYFCGFMEYINIGDEFYGDEDIDENINLNYENLLYHAEPLIEEYYCENMPFLKKEELFSHSFSHWERDYTVIVLKNKRFKLYDNK